MDQWVPIINLPERWTLTSKKNVSRDEFYLHTNCGVKPDGHITIRRSNFKALLNGGKKIPGRKTKNKTLLSVWDDLFKRGKGGGGEKKQRAGFPLWTGQLWSCVCQPLQPRWDGEALVTSRGGNGVLYFSVWSRTQYRWTRITCSFGKASVTMSETWGETRTRSRWVDQGLGPSLQKQSTRWNTGPIAVSLVWFKLFDVAVVVIYKEKGKGYTSSEDILCI